MEFVHECGRYMPSQPDSEFTSTLRADIDAGWHLYALDQPQGGPIPTTIKITEGRPFTRSRNDPFAGSNRQIRSEFSDRQTAEKFSGFGIVRNSR